MAEKARLQEFYHSKGVPQLRDDLKLSNRMEVPRITKITVNMGVGEAVADRKVIDAAVGDLTKITGQKRLICKAKKAIAAFKVREGMPIGCKVTLRGARMYEFLDRLISLALPRVRDFRGLNPNGFDGRGNYSLGLSEQLVFPELNPDKYTRTQGMNVTLVISGGSNDESRELLRAFGMPFKTEEVQGKAPAA